MFKPSAKKKKTHKKDSLGELCSCLRSQLSDNLIILYILSTEDYFSHGCEGAENSEVRFKLCQDLWDQIKTDTEVRTCCF